MPIIDAHTDVKTLTAVKDMRLYCKKTLLQGTSPQKGWGAIAKLLPLADSFLLSTNEKALFFTVLNKLSVAYFIM